jgi:hypothetical protein
MILSASWKLDDVFHCSSSRWNAHLANETAIFFNMTLSVTIVFDLILSVLSEDSAWSWTDAISPMDVLFNTDCAVVFSH